MCKHNANHLNSTPTKVDCLVNSVKASLQTTLETGLKRKATNQGYLTPWYNSQTSTMKQITQKLERILSCTHLKHNKTNKQTNTHKTPTTFYEQALDDSGSSSALLQPDRWPMSG